MYMSALIAVPSPQNTTFLLLLVSVAGPVGFSLQLSCPRLADTAM